MSNTLLLIAPLVYFLLAVPVALVAQRWRVLPAALIALGGVAGALASLWVLRENEVITLAGWQIAPFAQFSVRLDALAAFFVGVICLPAVAVAIYGIGYLNAAGADHQHAPPAAIDALLAAFLAAMTLVVLADNVFSFLIAWELMSLVSFFLVIGDGRQATARRAGFIYLVMTHISAGFLLLALLLLARQAGGFEFAQLRAATGGLDGWERNAVFGLALVGFGTKLGLIPLHVWLPRAHPAAPSHISALMSGVMVKTAIYGLVRVIWEFAGPGPAWWGGLLMALGAISAVLGILYALMERDLKRMLAYSTVEHVGIITIGVGAAALAASKGHPTVAALALTAALVHLYNHSVFKGLLFLGAGALQTGAGTRDLERMGGLIRRMPKTALCVLIGALGIAAVPPLSGFAGEWLLFQGLLDLGANVNSATIGLLVALAAGALALTGALAVAAFVRAFGVGFLAQPRSAGASAAREVPTSMLAGMALLAASVIAMGLAAAGVVRMVRPVTTGLVGTHATPALGEGNVFNAGWLSGAYAPWAVVAGLVAVGVLPWLVARLLGGAGRERVAPPWVCGVDLEPRMQYSATGFAKPIRLIFQAVIRPQRTVDVDRPISAYFVSSIRYDEQLHPIYERHLYQRGVAVLVGASRRIRTLQSGSIRAYIAYIFLTLLVVLTLTRLL